MSAEQVAIQSFEKELCAMKAANEALRSVVEGKCREVDKLKDKLTETTKQLGKQYLGFGGCTCGLFIAIRGTIR